MTELSPTAMRAGDDAGLLDVVPRDLRRAAVAAIRVGVEAQVLGGARHDEMMRTCARVVHVENVDYLVGNGPNHIGSCPR